MDIEKPVPTMVDSVPEHAPHTVRDDVDNRIEAAEKKRQQTLIRQKMQEMRGFVKAHLCSNCGKRIEPVMVNGRAQYGKCPYCQLGTYPSEETHYVGEVSSAQLGRSDAYANLDHDTFQRESANKGGTFNHRFNAKRN